MNQLSHIGALSMEGPKESHEKRARRLFDEMARNIGREAVNHIKTMYPHMQVSRTGA